MDEVIHRNEGDLRAEDFDAEWYLRAYADVAALGIDPFRHYQLYGRKLGRIARAKAKQLKRIVLIVVDASTIGGISSRTRRILCNASNRGVDYFAITLKNERNRIVANAISYADDPTDVERLLCDWTPAETVFIVSSNAIRPFPAHIRSRIMEFPIVYIAAGQMAFFIQDSLVLLDRDYVDSLRAMKIISFSEGDINFQRQLGIFGQVKGFVPIEIRAHNTYSFEKNTRIGYVGRIDFHAKDCERLIDVARTLRGTSYAPIRIYTTDGSNSPQFIKFINIVEEAGLENDFDFVVNCEDKEIIFGDLAILLVPSKKESFGNAIIEAFSFGIPVIAASYAPGPAEIIQDGVTGFLLDDFTGEAVRMRLETLSKERRMDMSRAAFERHTHYSISAHLDLLEHTAQNALQEFRGKNVLPVFPRLRIAEVKKK